MTGWLYMNENPDELDSFMGKNKVATHNINSNFFYYVKTKLKNHQRFLDSFVTLVFDFFFCEIFVDI